MRTPDDPVSETKRLRAVTILALAAVVLASTLVAYLQPHLPALPRPAAVETSPPQHFQYVTNTSFLDAGHAWVMSSLSPKPESYIYRTSDGGRHWRTLQAPVPVFDFSFLDARHGFAAGAKPSCW